MPRVRRPESGAMIKSLDVVAALLIPIDLP